MKKLLLSSLLCAASLTASAGVPDSVYIRPYFTDRGEGLHLEWSTDGEYWEYVVRGTVLSSDYGAWGREKKLFFPSMAKGKNGEYALVFQVNTRNNQLGITTTSNFVKWRPQDFPYIKGVQQCLRPVIEATATGYKITFESNEKFYSVTTTDLIHFSDPVQVSEQDRPRRKGVRVPYSVIRSVKGAQSLRASRDAHNNECAKDDDKRFGDLEGIGANIIIEGSKAKKISDKLMGIFFEDINYSADGGLYAELVQNRDFEYTAEDARNWNATTAWTLVGEGATMTIAQDAPIHENNSHYAVLDVKAPVQASLQNSGFDGITVKKGEKYDVSAFLRQLDGKGGKVNIVLKEGETVVGRTTLAAPVAEWKQLKATITATADAKAAVLCIEPTTTGKMAVDFVSLFPQKTFRGHKNGLRADLAETLAAMHPKFMRFPGGCVAHGNGIDNIYNWKETIGPLWERKAQPNLWGYHQSKGLGYYEYFQFCEDLQMEPLPVLAAGVPCQNSSHGGNGQQGGIAMDKMDAYIQDVLDLIEWANGDAKTTVWGRKRAEQGHPKPFNLHYIGIGNEDLISPTFEERYVMIVKAVKAKYPDITVCGTVGPFFEGSDYDEGWRIAKENNIDMVDEHYYVAPAWYMYNQDFYDHYDRSQSKVYVGEYAAHIPGRKSTIETALACAMHICGMERNGDIVEMSSYAPLLAKEGHTQWNPDLIYFNNGEVKPTVDYYTQMLCGQYSGDTYMLTSIKSPEKRDLLNQRLSASTVRDSKTGKTYLKIVNLLPCDMYTSVTFNDMEVDKTKEFKAVVLTGKYDSTNAKPVEKTVKFDNRGRLVVGPYTFMIIEL
ncbi:MAG: carbohydrate binding domain-containing protein [Bacteroidales bacterium]|nr:carbohydrate binding domain-containing protein [Bacteroidales bacterium]